MRGKKWSDLSVYHSNCGPLYLSYESLLNAVAVRLRSEVANMSGRRLPKSLLVILFDQLTLQPTSYKTSARHASATHVEPRQRGPGS